MLKYFYIPLLLSVLFISQSFGQWWVSGGNLSWPYGNVSVKGTFKSQRVQNNDFSEFLTDVNDSAQVAANLIVTSSNMDVRVDDFTAKNIIQNGNVAFGSTAWMWQTGGAIDDSYSMSGFVGSIGLGKTTSDTISNAFGIRSRIFSSDVNNWVRNYYGFHVKADAWFQALIINAYGYYSDGSSFSTSANAENFYHFYGEGDAPSYFGGAMIQKVYTYDVANPPSRGELDSIFGTPADAGSGFTVYIDDNGEGSNFYQVVSCGNRWWVFTAAQAP